MKKGSIETYGILMVVLMAIILIFIFLSLEGVFSKPESSLYYFNQITSMAGQSCFSNPTTNNINLGNPDAAVIQIYDNSTCNGALQSSTNLFNPSSPYNSNLLNNYDLCYANVTGITSGGLFGLGTMHVSEINGYNVGQYYYTPANVNSVQYASAPYPATTIPAGSTELGVYGLGAAEEVFTQSTQYSMGFYGLSPYSPNNVITLYIYINKSNVGYSLLFYDQGVNCYNTVQYLYSGVTSNTIYPTQCPAITNIVLQIINPNAAVLVQANISMTVSSKIYEQNVLSQQCMGLVNAVQNSEVNPNSIVCVPINCNNNNFVLTDASQQQRTLLAIIGENFGFLSIQSGSGGTLKIVNPNGESIESSSIFKT